jgi:hypothetical protein
MNGRSEAAAKAIRTAKWATTMTKWSIGFETRKSNQPSAISLQHRTSEDHVKFRRSDRP